MATELRVLEHKQIDEEGKTVRWYAIHAVYVGDSGLPQTCKEKPVAAEADTLLQLRENIQRMIESLDREILPYDELGL